MLAATMLAALAIGSPAAEAAATNGNGREGGSPGPPGATAGPGVPEGSGVATEDRRTPFERSAGLADLAAGGRLDLVRERLAAGADPNGMTHGRTGLQVAARHGDAEIMRVLLAAGADANLVARGDSLPLCLAAAGESARHQEAALLLLQSGARVSDRCSEHDRTTALMAASAAGHVDLVKALIGAGAEVDGADNVSSTALSRAAAKGHAVVVAELLAAGAAVDPRRDGRWTPLWLAADAAGLDHPASRARYAATARELLRHGAEVGAQPENDPRTPLLLAATRHAVEFVSHLLDSGARPDDRDANGQTALMHAANRGDAEMVSVLLAHGADRTLVDRYGRTALDLARMSAHPEVLRVLAGGEAKAARRSAGEDLADKGTPPQAARSLKEAWRFDAPAVIARGPFLVDDVLVFADAQGTIFALQASTGGRIWSYRGDGHITAVPVAKDGLLFVAGVREPSGAGAGTLSAFELSTGRLVWSASFAAGIDNLLSTLHGIVIRTASGDLRLLAARTGESLWRAGFGPESSRPVVAGDTLVLAAAPRYGTLIGLSLPGGDRQWQLEASQQNPRAARFRDGLLMSLPAGEARNAVLSYPEDAVFRFAIGACEGIAAGQSAQAIASNFAGFFGSELANALTARATAELCPPGTPPASIGESLAGADRDPGRAGRVVTEPVGDGAGNVFVRVEVGGASQIVVGVDAATGRKTFSLVVDDTTTTPPVTGAGLLFVHQHPDILAFDVRTGSRHWVLDVRYLAGLRPTMSFHDGLLIVAGHTLFAVDTATGKVRWRASQPSPEVALLAIRDEVVHCRKYDDYSGVDARTGIVLWTIRAGEQPGHTLRDSAHGMSMLFHARDKAVFGVGTW